MLGACRQCHSPCTRQLVPIMGRLKPPHQAKALGSAHFSQWEKPCRKDLVQALAVPMRGSPSIPLADARECSYVVPDTNQHLD